MNEYAILSWTWRVWLGSALGQLFWYGVMAFATWMFFYVIFRAWVRPRRVSRVDPTGRQIGREIWLSTRSIFVFGLITVAVVAAAKAGWTRLYLRIDSFGWVWFVCSILLMVVLHDTYFYWTHRLMHHRKLFRIFHRTHHLSMSPTPWAAYAFSVPEAFLQAGIGPLIVFTMPTHPAAFGLFMMWQITFNVLGHCGYEIFPSCFIRSSAGHVLNSVTHHALHHEKPLANFGLYFNVWDRWMGTNHRDYEQRFVQASNGSADSRNR